MGISKHISIKESTRSITAERLGIHNFPSNEVLISMQLLANRIFEPLRTWVNGPIRINSFYRSSELNKAIGGSARSQHCKGQAIDLDDTYGHKTNAEMFEYIKSNLSFDQLIWEFGDDNNPSWIHVSYVNEESNRNRILKATKENGKTTYKVI